MLCSYGRIVGLGLPYASKRTDIRYFDNHPHHHPLYKFPQLWNEMNNHLKLIPDRKEFLRSLKSNKLNKLN